LQKICVDGDARHIQAVYSQGIGSGLRGLSLMAMHNPPHPGTFIQEVYLEPNATSGRDLAAILDISASTLSRILNGSSSISPEMALRLSKAIGRSPESWLAMQDNYNLWQAKQTLSLDKVGRMEFRYA
jgi:antitoxin HigA-1